MKKAIFLLSYLLFITVANAQTIKASQFDYYKKNNYSGNWEYKTSDVLNATIVINEASKVITRTDHTQTERYTIVEKERNAFNETFYFCKKRDGTYILIGFSPNERQIAMSDNVVMFVYRNITISY